MSTVVDRDAALYAIWLPKSSRHSISYAIFDEVSPAASNIDVDASSTNAASTLRTAQLIAAREGVLLEELDWRPRTVRSVPWPYIDHALAVGRVRAAVELAAEKNGCSVDLWIGDAELKKRQEYVELKSPSGKLEKTACVPDSFMALQAPDSLYHGFWEIDRGGLTGQASKWQRRSWFKRPQAYLGYYYSRAYENEYGTVDMRLFTVTTGPRRLENLMSVTLKAGGRGRFWFTTQSEIHPERVLTEKIWSVVGKSGKRAILDG
jgi:hypothetical protein